MTDVDAAIRATAEVLGDGRLVTLDHLGEDTFEESQANDTVEAYLTLLARLDSHGLTEGAEVSVKLSAVGQSLPIDGEKIALENARRICSAAAVVGTTVTLDMEDHTTTDSTLGILRELRVDFPWVGAVLQAYLKRTEQDCRDLAYSGSRVRLCKGAYQEPASVAYQDKHDVDLSYVRCLKVLMEGQGYPMVASHDPRLIAIAADLASARLEGHLRVPDAVRHPARGAAPHRRRGQPHARVRAVRRRVVRLLHAPSRGASGQRGVLRALAAHDQLSAFSARSASRRSSNASMIASTVSRANSSFTASPAHG